MTLSPPANTHGRARTLPCAGTWRAARRGIVAIAGVLGALAAGTAPAVGLGPVTEQSSLGQSLRIVVPVLLAAGEDIPSECFKFAAAERNADGIPQILFGRLGVERTPSGMRIVISNPRPVNDPIVRVTLQAGCDAGIRREYTLFMDPPPIEPPVVAAEAAAREEVPAAKPPPVVRGPTRAGAAPRDATRSATGSGARDDARGAGKPGGSKARAATKTAPKRPPTIAASRPRLTVSSAAPGAGSAGAGAQAASDADREKAQQELANSIEAETVILRQRIVELTAMVERMQEEVRAQEAAQRAADDAAKAPAPVPAPAPAPEPDWWETNAPLLAAFVGLPLLIAGVLLWKRRQSVARDDGWRVAGAPAARAAKAPPAPGLRNAPAGLAKRGAEHAAAETAPATIAPDIDAINTLAVSELSQVTEEARVYVALGHPDRAIGVLQEHIRRLPRSLPAAWLMLLDLHHTSGHRQEFRRLAEEFHQLFNVQAPLWEGYSTDELPSGGLDVFPHIVKQVVDLWRKPDCRAYLGRLLYDNREGRRIGFPLSTYAEILLLLQILDAPEPVDVALDLVDDAGTDIPVPAPAATSAPAADRSRVRKPMPPDPTAAARPVQRPIQFEIDPEGPTSNPGGKPNA